MTRIDLHHDWPPSRIEKAIRERVAVMPTGCWEWTGTRNEQGYGRLWMSTGHRAAHRLAAHLWIEGFRYGDFPLLVCHRCDNPPCVNPEHLFIGTARDNALDASRKGRLVGWPGPRPGHRAYPVVKPCANCGQEYAPDVDHRGRSVACSLSCAAELRGRQRRGKGYRISPEMQADILARLATGETGKSIANDLGISTCSVSLIKNGKRVITR